MNRTPVDAAAPRHAHVRSRESSIIRPATTSMTTATTAGNNDDVGQPPLAHVDDAGKGSCTQPGHDDRPRHCDSEPQAQDGGDE